MVPSTLETWAQQTSLVRSVIASLLGDRFLQLLQIQGSIIENAGGFQGHASSFAHHLPGYQVRMVLHLRDNYFVAVPQRLQLALTKEQRVGHQVDRFSSVAHEDDFPTIIGADETGHVLMRLLV